jgi:hypothetical protein
VLDFRDDNFRVLVGAEGREGLIYESDHPRAGKRAARERETEHGNVDAAVHEDVEGSVENIHGFEG